MNTKLTLGIDVGGTNTVYGIVDVLGHIKIKGSLPTGDFQDPESFILAIREEVGRKLAEEGLEVSDIGGIGVGAPCLNPAEGVIEGAVDLPWPSPIPIAGLLKEKFGVRAAGENDANAAALGEAYYGQAKGLDNFIMLTLGTGVGSAIFCDGKLMHGCRGLAGELGHVVVRHGDEARECSCGRKGCLEMYASARGVVATAKEILSDYPGDSVLKNKEKLTPKIIFDAAEAGDEAALRIWEFTGRVLGEACANFTAFSSPEAIIFFGGVANAYPFFKDSMEEAYKANLLWVYKDQVRFQHSGMNEADAAVLGAAAVGRSIIHSEEQEQI